MSLTLVEALGQVDLEEGQVYRCQVKGHLVELRVLSDTDRSLTEVGAVLGTPRYMSPEQAAGRKDLTVTHDDLGEVLSLGFHQTQQLIKKHCAGDDFMLAEFEAERKAIREMERR